MDVVVAHAFDELDAHLGGHVDRHNVFDFRRHQLPIGVVACQLNLDLLLLFETLVHLG